MTQTTTSTSPPGSRQDNDRVILTYWWFDPLWSRNLIDAPRRVGADRSGRITIAREMRNMTWKRTTYRFPFLPFPLLLWANAALPLPPLTALTAFRTFTTSSPDFLDFLATGSRPNFERIARLDDFSLSADTSAGSNCGSGCNEHGYY